MNRTDAFPRRIREAIDAAGRVAILSHMRPDGDASGSQIALALALHPLDKRVCVWNEDGVPERYRFLPHSGLVALPPATPEPFDVVIALDTATRARLGTAGAAIAHADLWINIDHHVSNERYGDLVLIDDAAAATGEILHGLLDAMGLPMTPEIAACLFVAIATDTGSFQFPNTTVRTFEAAAHLAAAGADVGELSREVYENHPPRRLELLRRLLESTAFHDDGRVACWSLALDTSHNPEDHEGLIDILRAVRGVCVAACFEELPGGKTRVSLRSKDQRVDVSQIATKFGGGGHTLAAGARIPGPLPEVRDRVLTAVHHAIARID